MYKFVKDPAGCIGALEAGSHNLPNVTDQLFVTWLSLNLQISFFIDPFFLLSRLWLFFLHTCMTTQDETALHVVASKS